MVTPAWAQQPVPGGTQPNTSLSGGLRIFVLTGEGGVNRIPLSLIAETVVEVRDQNDLPVSGADVTFTLPATGVGGSYGTQKQYRTKTDNQGQASPVGLRLAPEAGRFQIRVDAVSGDLTASSVINQINSARPIATTYEEPKGHTKRWLIWGAIGAGVAAATILILTGDSNSSNPVLTLTPGPIGVGGPR